MDQAHLALQLAQTRVLQDGSDLNRLSRGPASLSDAIIELE